MMKKIIANLISSWYDVTIILEKQVQLSFQNFKPSVTIREHNQRMSTLGEATRQTYNFVPD